MSDEKFNLVRIPEGVHKELSRRKELTGVPIGKQLELLVFPPQLSPLVATEEIKKR